MEKICFYTSLGVPQDPPVRPANVARERKFGVPCRKCYHCKLTLVEAAWREAEGKKGQVEVRNNG